jgi:hypothetical protein
MAVSEAATTQTVVAIMTPTTGKAVEITVDVTPTRDFRTKVENEWARQARMPKRAHSKRETPEDGG